jgi:glycine hydroxymethyltransferase
LTGKEAEAILGAAHMTCNKNGIPNDPQKPMITSGIRLGTPALTTRGLGEAEMAEVAGYIDRAFRSKGDAATLAAVKQDVLGLCARFPMRH